MNRHSCLIVFASLWVSACSTDVGDAPGFSPLALTPSTTVTSSARGFVNISGTRTRYEYGPSIVLENGRYYAFYCSPGVPPTWDSIRMTSSSDSVNWTDPTVVLSASGPYGALAVCDPSVVKFRGQYFLYHTCISSIAPDGYRNNRICVAVSDRITGPYHRLDRVVVEDRACSPTDLSVYCVGQPSALVYRDQVRLYYTVTKPSDSGLAAGHIYLAISNDGILFTPANGGMPVFDHRNVDVKFERSSGQFVMVQGEADSPLIHYALSPNGLDWTPFDDSRILAENPMTGIAGGSNNNPGLAGDSQGTFDGMGFVMYGSSYESGWGVWQLYRSDFVINPDRNDCSACVAGSCDLGCSRVLGETSVGECAHPGSTNSGVCCVCAKAPPPADCSACVASGCVSACRAAGYQIGVCGIPGSRNPWACCSCYSG